MSTRLHEAVFIVARYLADIAEDGPVPRITGIHSVNPADTPGMLSVMLDISPAGAHGEDAAVVRVDARDLAGLDRDQILAVFSMMHAGSLH